MSKSRTSKPSYILSKSGKDKLKNYQDLSDSEINIRTGLDRSTIAKIRNGSQGVEKKSLERLFEKLEPDPDIQLELEDEDYQQFNRSPKTDRQELSRTSPNKDDLMLNETNTEKIKNVLGELNYSQQKFVFNETISRIKPAGTFLIHGKTDYGQRWLVNLLRYKVPYHTDAWQKSIYIKPHRKDIQTLWQSLAQELETSPLPEAVIEQLYQRWKNSTVILTIHNVDLMAGMLKQFINELWQPLVNKANHEKTQKTFRLVLFLVDNKNSKSKLETSLSLVTEPDKNQPHNPLALPELEPFNQDIIESWVGVQFQLLSQLWKSSESIEQVMQEIVERDNQPISVLKEICLCFELDWEQHIVEGLAL